MRLANDRVALDLVPEFGARVTALTDLATGRQWLIGGACEGDPGDGAIYEGREARGWDECFPTVAPCTHPDWGPMRDHGLLWGRPWAVEGDGAACSARYQDPRFAFRRDLRLTGAEVRAEYRVTNQRDRPFRYLWSQHALLAVTPEDRIDLQRLGPVEVGGEAIRWPDHRGRDLTRVGPAEEGLAVKAYAASPSGGSARVTGPNGGIAFHWDVPAFGLWLCYGGWPARGAKQHQIALEPTTAAADHLLAAEAKGQARALAPGESHGWSVAITLTGDPS